MKMSNKEQKLEHDVILGREVFWNQGNIEYISDVKLNKNFLLA
jgi:hypothetical protein